MTRLPFELIFYRSDDDGFTHKTGDFTVTSHPLSHRVPCFAYAFDEHSQPGHLCQKKLEELKVPRGPQWGQLQQGSPSHCQTAT